MATVLRRWHPLSSLPLLFHLAKLHLPLPLIPSTSHLPLTSYFLILSHTSRKSFCPLRPTLFCMLWRARRQRSREVRTPVRTARSAGRSARGRSPMQIVSPGWSPGWYVSYLFEEPPEGVTHRMPAFPHTSPTPSGGCYVFTIISSPGLHPGLTFCAGLRPSADRMHPIASIHPDGLPPPRATPGMPHCERMATEIKVPVPFCPFCAAKPKILRTPLFLPYRLSVRIFGDVGGARRFALSRRESGPPSCAFFGSFFFPIVSAYVYSVKSGVPGASRCTDRSPYLPAAPSSAPSPHLLYHHPISPHHPPATDQCLLCLPCLPC